jgi:hypothetical protein
VTVLLCAGIRHMLAFKKSSALADQAGFSGVGLTWPDSLDCLLQLRMQHTAAAYAMQLGCLRCADCTACRCQRHQRPDRAQEGATNLPALQRLLLWRMLRMRSY